MDREMWIGFVCGQEEEKSLCSNKTEKENNKIEDRILTFV